MKRMHIMAILVLLVACSPNRSHLPNNRDEAWKEESKPLEVLVQWIGKKTGKPHVLDEHAQNLGIRLAPTSYDPFLLQRELERSYNLTFKEFPDRVVVSADALAPFYDQFVLLPGDAIHL